MYIHLQKLIGFLAHPRTGSRTLRDMCILAGFKPRYGHHSGPEKDPGNIPDGMIYFCMVRNHWDAIVSWWFYKNQHLKEDLISAEWVQQLVGTDPKYFKLPNLWWFTQEVPDALVLRHETYDKDIIALFEWCGLDLHPTASVVDLKYKRDRGFRRYYTPEAKELVANLFAVEINRLGYSWND